MGGPTHCGVTAATTLQNGRADTLPVYSWQRGSKSRAIAIASDPLLRQTVVGHMRSDTFATTANATRNRNLRLWNEVMSACGHNSLTPRALEEVAAVLKASGYHTATDLA